MPTETIPPLDVLAIAAHPDDVEMTCGGTLIKMAEKGYRTGVLDLTAGDMGTRGTPETRLEEAAAAARHLLLAWRGNLHLPDAQGLACVDAIQKLDERIPVVVLSGQDDEDFAVSIQLTIIS